MKKQTLCKKPGCRFEHHAKGFCKRHYNQFVRAQELLQVQEQPPADHKPQHQEKRKSRKPEGTKNFTYFLNEKFLEKIFIEAAKAHNDTLYKVANGAHIQQLLSLALNLAGYSGRSAAVYNEILDDLRTWAEARDRIRFLEVLENWEDYAEKYSHLEKPQQLSLFK